MSLEFKPLSDVLGVEVRGVDLTGDYDAETKARLCRAFLEHHLLLVRGQEISAEDEIRFAELFGPVSNQGGNMKHGGKIMHISNAHKDGAFPTGELLFHSDHVFFEHPLKAIALYAMAVPSKGGDTLFSNAALAWDNLPQRLKDRVRSLSANNIHDYGNNSGSYRINRSTLSDKAVNYVHPIAWPHPETGRTILLINRLMTDEIVGLERAESDALLEELFSYTEDRKIVYQHEWALYDLVIWDNRILQHARTNFDPKEKRVLRRVPIAEESTAAGLAAE